MGLSAAILLACVLCAADVCALMELVHRRRGGGPSYGVVPLAAGAVAGVVSLSVAAVVLQGVFGLSMFGRAHVLYSSVTVAVPLVGAWIVVRCAVGALRSQDDASTAPWAIVVGVVLLVPGAVGAWSSFVAPYDLRTDRVELVVSDGPPAAPIRVGVLADIQTERIGDHERDAVAQMMAEEPDLIVVVGDYVQAPRAEWATQVEPLRDLLSGLSAPGGVFVVQGNVDEPDLLREAVGGSGATYLENEIVTTEVRGREVTIGGIEFFYARDTPGRTIRELEAIPDEADDLRLLLAHSPDAVTELRPGSPVDLVVSGHTHGGQVSFPVMGLLFTAVERVPDAVAAGGLSTVAGNEIYVSTGVGMERGQAPQVRFRVPPSIGIVTVG